MLRCAVVGARGYAGLEVVKLLLSHPDVEISYLVGSDDTTCSLHEYIPGLFPGIDLNISGHDLDQVADESDVVFLALPHRASMGCAERFLKKNTVVIDLSADYRFKHASVYQKHYATPHTSPALLKQAVYGLSELNHDAITQTNLIANPGCFPTGVILGLAPLLKKNLIVADTIIIDAKTGVSGAGRQPSAANHFGELHENFKAYKVNQHQHAPEIEEQLTALCGQKAAITFVPHLLPVARGILSTMYLECKKGVKKKDIMYAYQALYRNQIFIRLKDYGQFPQLSDVARTNFCDIGFTFDQKKSRLIVITAIDNLLKGAAGQAVQNMNIRCGFSPESGFFA